jgi:TonB family protein
MRPQYFFALLVVALGCHSSAAPGSAPATSATSLSPCADVVARARREPDLRVDRVPEPLAMTPPPIKQPVPAGVVGKRGAEVEVQVVVDTSGRADMRTFKVVRATHPWLGQSVKSAVRQWKFVPAELEGCKVPRLYHFAAKSKGWDSGPGTRD